MCIRDSTEIEAQGQEFRWLLESTTHHGFLEYAMSYHKLGVHEHKPYKQIDYRQIEA